MLLTLLVKETRNGTSAYIMRNQIMGKDQDLDLEEPLSRKSMMSPEKERNNFVELWMTEIAAKKWPEVFV